MKSYETKLRYLSYSSTSDRISIPIRLRERHLTPSTKEVVLQAIGTHLQIAIWSARDNILIRLPFDCWYTSKEYVGRMQGENNGIIPVGRFEDYLDDIAGNIKASIFVHDIPRP